MKKIFLSVLLFFGTLWHISSPAFAFSECSNSVLKIISQDQCEAIASYKQVEYTDINFFLRNGKWHSEDKSELLNLLRAGVTKLPIFKGKVYRGTSFEGSPKLFKDYTTLENIVSDRAFSSTSESRSIAESFITDNGDSKFVLLVINSRTGRNIQGIGASGIDTSEKEILFLPSTKFKIIKVKKIKMNNPEYGLYSAEVHEVHMDELL